jgi:hypothetical protein
VERDGWGIDGDEDDGEDGEGDGDGVDDGGDGDRMNDWPCPRPRYPALAPTVLLHFLPSVQSPSTVLRRSRSGSLTGMRRNAELWSLICICQAGR